MLCDSYEIAPSSTTGMFGMTLTISLPTLFDAHFLIDTADSQRVDALFTSCFDSHEKEEEFSIELESLRETNFKKEGETDKPSSSKLADRITTLNPLVLPSDKN